jgi:hypothetical protein
MVGAILLIALLGDLTSGFNVLYVGWQSNQMI